MPGANLIFHLASGFVLLGLSLYLVKFQKRIDFSKKLLNNRGDSQPGWLIKDLKNFADLIGCCILIPKSLKDTKPRMINLSELLEVHLQYHVSKISIEHRASKVSIKIYVDHPLKQSLDLEKNLERSLSSQLKILTN